MRVLVVEDDKAALDAMSQLVAAEGHEVATASTLEESRDLLSRSGFDVVLADLYLPDGEGLSLLEGDDSEEFDLVLITGQASLETAVSALRQGAIDYLTKPVDFPRLRALLAQFDRTTALRREVTDLRSELQDAGRFGSLIGASEAMREVYRLIERVAPTDATVFITGESGTGKEVVAQTVHDLSARRQGSMLPLNCGAVSPQLIESELFGHERGSFTGAERRHEGHFERAHGGTLLLDEITEMPIELQVKLLRVLETGSFLRVGGTKPIRVDVRVLAACNRNPREAVESGSLREDLYYRLRVFPIHLPPLRDREDDVELLARHFLDEIHKRSGRRVRLSDRALEQLAAYSWPGNVRELKNAIERSAIMAEDRIELGDLPPEVRANEELIDDGPYLRVRVGTELAAFEKRMILATLRENDDRRKDTAEQLGISEKTLYNRLKAYEAEEEEAAKAASSPDAGEDD
ncbi:MAG: sigma-54-dependent Fis family transcriptional regulator [Acidobacteria bacterium]|nr:MAG: sigma-54-dependent Fis family transcriptional regulator [Acidobacteriota bacterium]REK07705.1 MAG: sigma-54-dependent Fis family transcriptional regulator [Acidobacteriota bacterium]